MNPHLSPQQQQQVQQLLLRQRSQLAEQQQRHLDGAASRAEHAREVLLQDGDDAPQRDADREVDLAISDREAVALHQIDLALQRLQQGEFGACEDCGSAIPWARLQLQPTALRCVACESARERLAPRTASM